MNNQTFNAGCIRLRAEDFAELINFMIIQKSKIPKVIFESGWLLDDSIAELAGSPLNEDASTEIQDRLAEFQESWDHTGVQLLEPIISDFGIGFKEMDIKGILLCGKLCSHSHPLLINVKAYLKTAAVVSASMEEFNEVIFHELLHILLQDNLIAWPTPFIERFKNEDFEVQAHLHLMSLQKFAHVKLGKDTKVLMRWYSGIGDNYSRAWEIIGEEEAFNTLLAEIPVCFSQTS